MGRREARLFDCQTIIDREQIMNEPLAEVLDRYFASKNQRPVRPDSDGVFAIDAGDNLIIGATTLDDGRMELYSNPGYVSAATLRAILEDDEDDDFDDDDDTAAVPGAARPS